MTSIVKLRAENTRLRTALDDARKIIENSLYTNDDGSVCYPEVVRRRGD